MADSKSGKKFKWWHACSIMLLLFVAFIAYVGVDLVVSTGPAIDATDEFFIKLSTGENIETIYEEDVADGFKEVTSYEDFKAYVESLDVLREYEYIEYNSRGVYEDEGIEFVSLFGTMHGTSSITPVEVQVVEEDGKWKIRYVHLGS